jgi:hypothetical protein
LHLKEKERGTYFDQTPLSYHPASAYKHTYIFRAYVNHAVLLQSPFQPWTQDLVQGYRWVNRAPTVKQASEVCLP